MWIIINKKTFRGIFGQLQTQEYKAMKKQIVRPQLNEKKSKKRQTRLMSCYWKRKSTWKKDLIIFNSHPWIMFSFNWLVIIWRYRSFEIGHPRSNGWKNLGRRQNRGARGGGGVWTIFMDVICRRVARKF